ncbi:MAG: CoA-binding protein [Deltaproteobacteria bacterium]|nr:CoA-binding protein [Deltaproteobacteria bacterium]
MSYQQLETILHPRSVAVIGATANMTSFGYSYAHHMVEYGFKGPIYFVNPNYPEILGVKTYPSVRDIPDQVDYAISCVSASQVIGVLEELAEKGVKGVHLFTARFSETGRKEAAELEQSVLKLAREKGIRLIGPNCMGVYHPKAGISFGYNLPKDSGGVGMASQSGGGASGFVHMAAMRGIRFSKVISYGNALDFTECDYLDYFIRDAETKIIILYIEGPREGERFFEMLRSAAKVKPVIVMKGGRGKAGSRMTTSHTASLAGSFRIWEDLLKQAGAVSARDFEELADLAVSFTYLPALHGNRIGVIGGGGGPSVIAAEACEEAGLDVIPIPEDMREEISRRGIPIWDWISNPVDLSIVGGSGITDIDMLRLMGRHPDFDALMVNMNEWVLYTLAYDERYANLVNQVKNYISVRDECGKPFAMVFGEQGLTADNHGDWHWKVLAEARSHLINAGVAIYPTLHRAATALNKVREYYSRDREGYQGT